MSRKTIIAANWKLNKGPKQAAEYFEEFLQLAPEDSESNFLFFLPSIDLLAVRDQLINSDIGWGAQNIYFESEGAYTGENSASVCKEIGNTHVLIGHSERRSLFAETNEWVAKKVKAAFENGLTPVLCVGESLEQREQGETNDVLKEQINQGLSLIGDHRQFVVAYEPVWAIGTGKVATPNMANEAHLVIRQAINSLVDGLGASTSILYGGSVKPGNAAELHKQSEIDGFLVGGASLEPETFFSIYKAIN